MNSSSWAQLDISIVTYNSARWLPGFIESLLNQNYATDSINILVRDNGSTDTTWDWLQSQEATFKECFLSVHLVRGDNIGFGAGHNDNLSRSNAEYFMVSNVDLIFESDTLAALVSAAKSSASDIACWECRQKPFEHPKNYHPATLETVWCSSACALFRTEALKSVGGYEERLFLYGEDVELSYRLRDQGWKLHYIPKATVWHYTYEQAGQVKKAQFLGSTLANALIRCRFGSFGKVLQGGAMLLALLFYPSQFKGQRWGVLVNIFKFVYLMPAFLYSRKRSDSRFPIRLWDYEITRDGAFYSYSEASGSLKPKVSILIRTTPGRLARLREAVASVFNQTYENIELVIVEDGGSAAEGYTNPLQTRDSAVAIQYISLPKMGRCRSGNVALKASTGEFICFLDDDDLLYADHVEVLVDALTKAPELGGVYALAFQVDTQVQSLEKWRYTDILHKVIYRQPFDRAILWHHNFMPIQSVMFRRELYEIYGGFDADLDNLEDWNLWVRYTQNRPFHLIEKVTSLYRVPYESTEVLQRQQTLDDYYLIAVEKNDSITIDLKPSEVVQMAEKLAQQMYFVAVPRSRLRNMVLRMPGARWFIRPAMWFAQHLRARLRS